MVTMILVHLIKAKSLDLLVLPFSEASTWSHLEVPGAKSSLDLLLPFSTGSAAWRSKSKPNPLHLQPWRSKSKPNRWIWEGGRETYS